MGLVIGNLRDSHDVMAPMETASEDPEPDLGSRNGELRSLHIALYDSLSSRPESFLIKEAIEHSKSNKPRTQKKHNKAKKSSIENLFASAQKSIEDVIDTMTSPLKGLEATSDQLSTSYAMPKKTGNKFKNFYMGLTKYTTGAYQAVAKSGKKVAGMVRMTFWKVLKMFEYIMTMGAPQWNRVPGSPEDMDTHAMQITNHESADPENMKYNLSMPTSVSQYRE